MSENRESQVCWFVAITSLELTKDTKEFLGPLFLSVVITVESISKGKAALHSPPLVNECFFFQTPRGKRGFRFSSQMWSGFDALHAEADGCTETFGMKVRHAEPTVQAPRH